MFVKHIVSTLKYLPVVQGSASKAHGAERLGALKCTPCCTCLTLQAVVVDFQYRKRRQVPKLPRYWP